MSKVAANVANVMLAAAINGVTNKIVSQSIAAASFTPITKTGLFSVASLFANAADNKIKTPQVSIRMVHIVPTLVTMFTILAASVTMSF
jgi:hypothetical protein